MPGGGGVERRRGKPPLNGRPCALLRQTAFGGEGGPGGEICPVFFGYARPEKKGAALGRTRSPLSPSKGGRLIPAKGALDPGKGGARSRKRGRSIPAKGTLDPGKGGARSQQRGHSIPAKGGARSRQRGRTILAKGAHDSGKGGAQCPLCLFRKGKTSPSFHRRPCPPLSPTAQRREERTGKERTKKKCSSVVFVKNDLKKRRLRKQLEM